MSQSIFVLIYIEKLCYLSGLKTADMKGAGLFTILLNSRQCLSFMPNASVS